MSFKWIIKQSFFFFLRCNIFLICKSILIQQPWNFYFYKATLDNFCSSPAQLSDLLGRSDYLSYNQPWFVFIFKNKCNQSKGGSLGNGVTLDPEMET